MKFKVGDKIYLTSRECEFLIIAVRKGPYGYKMKRLIDNKIDDWQTKHIEEYGIKLNVGHPYTEIFK